MTDEEESPADRDERIMLSHHINQMREEEGMLIAYQHGAASMKDRIRELEAERDKLKETINQMRAILETDND